MFWIALLWLVAFKEIPQRELRQIGSNCSKSPKFWLVAFKEIPQRELRLPYPRPQYLCPALPLLHSKKSHKGNWDRVPEELGASDGVHGRLHSKKSHKGNWELEHHDDIRYRSEAGCIQRNPTKGIESSNRRPLGRRKSLSTLHSKKSHKGNWEEHALDVDDVFCCCVLHSKKSHKGNWENKDTLTIQPSIPPPHSVAFKEIPQRELRENMMQPFMNNSVKIRLVAFKEIPQRELRVPRS